MSHTVDWVWFSLVMWCNKCISKCKIRLLIDVDCLIHISKIYGQESSKLKFLHISFFSEWPLYSTACRSRLSAILPKWGLWSVQNNAGQVKSMHGIGLCLPFSFIVTHSWHMMHYFHCKSHPEQKHQIWRRPKTKTWTFFPFFVVFLLL